jgi:hypothetical protein
MSTPNGVRILLAAVIVTVAIVPAGAQVAPAASLQPAVPDAAALYRLVTEQRALLEAQTKVIDELKLKLDETSRLAASTERRLLEIERQQETPAAAGPAPAAATADAPPGGDQQSPQKLPELASPTETPEFLESFRVPGTEASIRFGGQVRTLVVRNIGAVGTDDRFVTSSIPIEGTPEAGKTSRTTVSASPSRLETDLRTPTPVGQLRAFVSGDFAGSNRTYRLRHAFGEWRGFTVGQTWSTFSDPEAEPDGIDFEGLNAISLFRQPILRWTTPVSDSTSFALALENPSPDLTGATGVSQVPDLIARFRWNKRRTGLFLPSGGHTQAALLVRQLRGDPIDRPNQTLSAFGIGVHLSGSVPSPWRSDKDLIKFATAAGVGIGRYITDLGSVGGQDAVYNASDNSLEPLPVVSTYIGYEHWWTEQVRSTGTFGWVFVDNLAIQEPDSLRNTTRGSFNVSWSPIPRVDLVAEFLFGRRTNKDKQHGTAGQLQVGWIFRF